MTTEPVCFANQDPPCLERELLLRGVRMTPQRRTILGVIEQGRGCSPGMIYLRAKKLDSGVHRATVYRTLALLRRQGMLDEHAGTRGCPWQGTCQNAASCDQARMRCLRCGKVCGLGSCLFGELTRRLEKDCRFRVARTRLEIEGYCQTCRT